MDICPNWWQLKQRITCFFYCSQLQCLPKISIPSIKNFELISEWQDMLMMDSDFRFTDEWNLLIFEFWLKFLSTNCLISSVEIKGFMFFISTFLNRFEWEIFRRSCRERYCLFLSLMFLCPFLFLCDGYPTFWKNVRVLDVYLFTGEFLNSLFNLCWIFGS